MTFIPLGFHDLLPEGNMYHLHKSGTGHPADFYSLSAATFRSHISLIRQVGLPISVWKEPNMMNEKGRNILITFDDGGTSNWEVARPILDEFNCKAHFFVCTKLIGKKGYLNSDQVKNLSQEGHLIGSHTETHALLSTLNKNELEREIRASKEYLENLLNKECFLFCPPGGDITTHVIHEILATGYKLIFTSRPPVPLYQCRKRMIGRWIVRAAWTMDYLNAVLHYKPSIILPILVRYYGLSSFKKLVGVKRYNKLKSRFISKTTLKKNKFHKRP